MTYCNFDSSSGLLIAKKAVDEDGEEKVARTVRSTVYADSDSE